MYYWAVAELCSDLLGDRAQNTVREESQREQKEES